MKGDKVARLRAVEPVFASGLIYAPDTDWAEMVIDETMQFPRGAHSDWVDTCSLGLFWLRRNGVLLTKEEYDEDELVRSRLPPRQPALYEV